MQNLKIGLVDKQFHIDGFPLAARVIEIKGQQGMNLAHLSLHVDDLEFALECLREVDKSTSAVTREALWRSAVISYAKCFGSNARRKQLASEKVFKGTPAEARLAHNYFKSLRNKHFAHDENAFGQALPAAIINPDGAERKVEKVVCLGAFALTLEQGNGTNLWLLIETALAWLRAQFDALAEQIRLDLERTPHRELLCAPIIKYVVPGPDDVANPRPN